MRRMKKIIVNRGDEAAEIVEKIIEADDNDLILAVPRFSHIGKSLSNFHLLKREAAAVQKRITVESVDDQVIELSEMSGLPAINPFFIKNNKRQFSDIVAPKQIKVKKHFVGKIDKKEPVDIAVEDKFAALETRLGRPPEFIKKSAKKFYFPKIKLGSLIPSGSSVKKSFIIIISLAAALSIIFIAVKVLPEAKATVIAKKQNSSYDNSILADKAAVIDIQKMSVPAQVFIQKKNIQLKFQASGKKQVKNYAGGQLTVYNSYSSDQQQLVEKTRFVTPDGKIFRLKKTVTVPGAKIIDGKIAPSSINMEVVADAPGPDYNIGPVKLFTIPGLKGGPKYQSFYGESTGNMSGGFIGDVAYPTEDDIKKAKESAKTSLENSLRVLLLAQIPKEFKIVDGALSNNLISQKIDDNVDEDGQFGIFSEAQIAVIAFRDDDVKNLLVKRVIHDAGDNFEARNYTLEYGLARVDFEKGKLTFPVKFDTVLAEKVDVDGLRSKLVGKSEKELRPLLASLPGIESVTVSLWPIWVRRVPLSSDKIKIEVK